MSWPKGKPRGPQLSAHRTRLASAVSEGQRRRFANPAARDKMSQAIATYWHSCAVTSERTEARTRRINVSVSEEDWTFLHWMSEHGDVPISIMVREAITASRKECEQNAREDGIAPGWLDK